jgi:diguanylate cyclase (GGDEF)-like protein
LAQCFTSATNSKQSVFRIGGDEFVIVCRKTSEEELSQLVQTLKKNVAQTKYSCSVGYCYDVSSTRDFEEMVKRSDEMMYEEKARFYSQSGHDRRLY